MSAFWYGPPGKLMSIDGYLTARCERNVAKNRLAYIGIGNAERTSNFGCATEASAMAGVSVCLQLSGTTKITLEHDSEYVINMDTGEHLGLESVGPETLERLRLRWTQAGHLEDSLNAIAKQFPVIPLAAWKHERVEQSMNMRFLRGTESVLELGACIGRNSLVIASILNKHGGGQVSVEANPDIAKQLKESQLASGLRFNIVDRPLSRQRMIVRKWVSQCIGPKAKVPPGWREVPTITLQSLKNSTGVNSFDTLVIDCEGAFHGIMNEFPQVLKDVTKVLIENDSRDAGEAEAIHARLRQHGLVPIWSQRLDRHKIFPKRDVFWQCWVKLA
jgi:FkbM family methyltransferase